MRFYINFSEERRYKYSQLQRPIERLKKVLGTWKAKIHSSFRSRCPVCPVSLLLVACKFPFHPTRSFAVSYFFLLLEFLCTCVGGTARCTKAMRFEIQRCRTRGALRRSSFLCRTIVLLPQLWVPKLSRVLARCTVLPVGFRETAVTQVQMLPVSFGHFVRAIERAFRAIKL